MAGLNYRSKEVDRSTSGFKRSIDCKVVAATLTRMDLDWTPDDVLFRDEVRAFLAEHLTDDIRAAGRRMTSVYAEPQAQREWQRILAAKGWAAPSWPVEYGGCAWTVLQRYIFARERVAAGAPPLSPMGIQMCGPALIGFGTPEQKRHFLPRMLSGEHFWCQGYSEPQAGSDLAALEMWGEDGHDDSLVCSGTKIWITHAQEANWVFCLVRTSHEGRPQQGITFLLIDMTTAGIEVRPIISPAGENIQNEIIFDQVRVPKANIVGEIGRGWSVAKYLLEYERGGTAYAPELQAQLDEVVTMASDQPGISAGRLVDDPVFSAKLAAARIRILALEMYEFKAMSAIASGGSPGASASIMKIVGTELSQHITELALEAAGSYGRAYQPHAGRPAGTVHFKHSSDAVVGSNAMALAPLRYINNRAASIYAGSNEIQRNLLAKAVLGL